jgi:hypothetical protein
MVKDLVLTISFTFMIITIRCILILKSDYQLKVYGVVFNFTGIRGVAVCCRMLLLSLGFVTFLLRILL